MLAFKVIILVVVLFLLPGAARSASIAEDLKNLIEQGKLSDAYRLGQAHPDLLGDPDFDFFYGLAAVESGRLGEGVLALERYLLNFPANDRARLELARAYFLLGEDARARDEFVSIRDKNPPQQILLTIDRYLDAIRIRQGRYETTSRFYVEAGFGRDSNVNSGVASSSLNLPTLGNVFVSPAGTRLGDRFLHLAGGGVVTKPVAPGVSVFFSGDATLKNFQSETAFNQSIANFSGGATWLKESNIYRAALTFNRAIIENDNFRDVSGISADWIRQLNQQQSVTTSISYALLDYQGANSVRNAEVTGLGLGFRQVFSGEWQPVLTVSGNYAQERNQESRSDLGRDLYGGNAQINFSPAAEWGINLGYTLSKSRYGGADPLMLVTRADNYQSLDVALIRLIDRHWSVRAEIVKIKNTSNIALYEFNKDVFAVKLRHEWK